MRTAASVRLAVSLLSATVLHGVAFGVAAIVLSGAPATPVAAPAPLDVDVVEVTPPKPDPLAEAAPRPALVPAKLVVAVAHHHPREVASARLLASNPAPVDPSAPAEGPGPATPAPPTPPAVALSRGPAAPAPSAGGAISAQPRYRSNPKPEYPLPSLRRREEGVVLLNVVVQPDGLPGAISLKRSSGHPLLDRAALEVVRRRSFEPARAAGVPVSSLVEIPVRFSLADGP